MGHHRYRPCAKRKIKTPTAFPKATGSVWCAMGWAALPAGVLPAIWRRKTYLSELEKGFEGGYDAGAAAGGIRLRGGHGESCCGKSGQRPMRSFPNMGNKRWYPPFPTPMALSSPNVGDSRAYLLTRENVTQITRDHSIVQEMLESGEITEEQARNHPRKNIITRALGVDDTVVVDYFEIPFEEHAKLLLCSDGFSGSLTPERIYHFSRGLTAERITQRAIELAKEAGGNDNITVITISR